MVSVLKQYLNGSPYEVALESAASDLERMQAEIRDLRKALAIAEAHVREIGGLIDRLIQRVPPERRAAYERRLAPLQSPIRSGRGTTTYENVIELFVHQPPRTWTAPDVHKELAAKGIPSDPDQIHNVFQYLARKGRLRRISRGRYEVVGYGVGIEGDPMGGYE